jgi:hypothetical protein
MLSTFSSDMEKHFHFTLKMQAEGSSRKLGNNLQANIM